MTGTSESPAANEPALRLLMAGTGAAVRVLECAAVAASSSVTKTDTVVLFEIGSDRSRPATIFSTGPAKSVERALKGVDPAITVRARGRIVLATVPDDGAAAGRVGTAIDVLPAQTGWVIASTPGHYRDFLESEAVAPGRVAICSDSTGEPDEDPLVALALEEAGGLGIRAELVRRQPGRLAARRALAGRPCRKGSSGGPQSGRGGESPWRRDGEADSDPEPGPGPVPESGLGPNSERKRGDAAARILRRLAGDRGQAMPLVLGGVFSLIVGAVVLAAIAGAVTGKAKAQRAVDLAAMSAAGSMRDDLPRLTAPPVLPNGAPNPAHMSKAVYLARARLAATRIAVTNGASPVTVLVRFPDRLSFAPVRARVAVRTTVRSGDRKLPAPESWAEAMVGAPLDLGTVPTVASGGGYSGPLTERQGKGMRPDTADAFDSMAAAADAAGVVLTINSAFRSDAEQAALFAANPDPTWVARPGTSLHRCGTELDLGPPSAYGWLAANAARFGFTQRYSWEPWHFGLTSGPPPCSGTGNRVTGSGADPSRSARDDLPSFVPDRYRRPILSAAMKWGVSADLLAAQLMAESNFNPRSVSPAGAQGIAQFMPGTAAAYGLRDPFDPDQAIDAQGHLMSDLLEQFGSTSLALAAYNAGPGAVVSCDCVPDIPETRAYVSRILALVSGAGAIAPVPMDVVLVR